MTSPDQPGDAIADAVVVAAGRSQRMGGVDKLAWSIGGLPLLAHTLRGLAAVPSVRAITVVTATDRLARLAAAPWLPVTVVAIVPGGDRRQDSVQAGFAALERAVPDATDRDVVLVHDGARPVVDAAVVAAVIAAAAEHGAAIPVVPIVETVKRVADGRIVGTEDRTTLARAQTPQAIRRDVLRRALADPRAASTTWTDEAALLEACTIPVHVVPGDPSNLKVTVPTDLAAVATSLTPAGGQRRHGIGHDAHPFGPGAPLRLGGVVFEGVPRLHGHSDGDAVLHAVADGLLGAAGLGDLGGHFPADARTPRGIDSAELLDGVVAHVRAAGWRPAGLDLTIIAARPRLGDRLPAIRDRLAALLDVDAGTVNVKASTGNLQGSEGAGRAVSAIALVAIEPIP